MLKDYKVKFNRYLCVDVELRIILGLEIGRRLMDNKENFLLRPSTTQSTSTEPLSTVSQRRKE